LIASDWISTPFCRLIGDDVIGPFQWLIASCGIQLLAPRKNIRPMRHRCIRHRCIGHGRIHRPSGGIQQFIGRVS